MLWPVAMVVPETHCVISCFRRCSRCPCSDSRRAPPVISAYTHLASCIGDIQCNLLSTRGCSSWSLQLDGVGDVQAWPIASSVEIRSPRPCTGFVPSYSIRHLPTTATFSRWSSKCVHARAVCWGDSLKARGICADSVAHHCTRCIMSYQQARVACTTPRSAFGLSEAYSPAGGARRAIASMASAC